MSDQEIAPLPAKTRPGLDLDKVFIPGRNSGKVAPAENAPRFSRPDLSIPAEDELSKEDWFPVRMLRHYRPKGDYQIADEDEEGNVVDWRERPELEEEDNPGLEWQVKEGMLVHLRKTEARVVIKAEIADRADPID